MALVELRITGWAILDSVRLDLGPGMNALTGETGAGKSLCVAGLRLVLGGRAEPPAAPGEARPASVAAVFDEVTADVDALIRSHGIPADDLLTLARELRPGGRGACRVNGALVSLATLREVGEALVEVTAQGESTRLLRPGRRRALLDAFGGAAVAGARRAVATALADWRAARDRHTAALAAAARDAAAIDAARDLLAELEPLHLRRGEDAELGTERERLRHAAELAAAATALHDACSGVDDGRGAADLVAAAAVGARPLLELDARLASVVAEARDVVERLRDLGARALALSGGVEVDAARMAAVEERLELLDRVRRRHGGTLDRALAELEEAGDLVEAAEGEGDEALRLAGEVAERESGLAAAATRLSARRALAATALERAVTERLRRLRLPQARFRVVLSRTPDADGLELDGARVGCGPDGIDAVDFRLATTADGVPLPLDGCASGGELSRVALALRAVAAAADDCPTLVLDEVDIGLGGETAARVGEVLAEVAGGSVQGFAARVSRVSGAGTSEARGGDRQVVVITHRAEIAARACHHLVVTRRERGGGAIADVARVEGEERVAEVARLMSGQATPAALLRARELLADGARRPAQRGRPAPARRNRAAGGAR